MAVYERSIEIAAPVERVFDFHLQTANLVRISPSWMRVQIVEESGDYAAGTKRVKLRMYLLGFLPSRVDVFFLRYEPPHVLDDCQERGPFAEWQQMRRFSALDARRSVLHDRVEYRLPLGPIGRLADLLVGRHIVRRMFTARQQLTRDLILRDGTEG